MLWIALWAFVFVAGLAGLVITTGSALFARQVRHEAAELWVKATAPAPRAEAPLPAPVRRYLERATAGHPAPVRTLRMQHGGTIRPSPKGGWYPIRGEQYFSAAPLGFVWWGRVRLGPGLWIDVRDKLVGDAAHMRLAFASALPMGNANGPDLTLGAQIRVLCEAVLFPGAFADPNLVRWIEIDDRSARATLVGAAGDASATFEFGPDGLPSRVTALRPRDLGDGRSELARWSGVLSDFRAESGLLVPHAMEAIWHLEGGDLPVIRFTLERFEYDVAEPF